MFQTDWGHSSDAKVANIFHFFLILIISIHTFQLRKTIYFNDNFLGLLILMTDLAQERNKSPESLRLPSLRFLSFMYPGTKHL